MFVSRAPVFSCAHYFQAPATQVSLLGVQIAVEVEGWLRYTDKYDYGIF